MLRAVKIIDALFQAKKILDSQNIISSNLDSNILLAHSLSFSREQVVFNPNLELDLNQQRRFFDLIKLRSNYQPVSQIIGKREFFGEDFFVTSDVLDPRPDSESLIELVLKKYPNQDKELNSQSSCSDVVGSISIFSISTESYTCDDFHGDCKIDSLIHELLLP